MSRLPVTIAVSTLSLAIAATADASFHLMQIEQVIAGVGGDTSMQAVQLRMRSPLPQNEVEPTRITVYDAAGENPVVLVDFDDEVPNGGLGVQILVCSTSFSEALSETIEPDFLMTGLIPESYFTAGSLTFEDDTGLVIWRLSWGGDAYTGPHDGLTFNDDDGDFGPAFGCNIPTVSGQALRFLGSASDPSTNNLDDYAVGQDPSVWTNNNGDFSSIMVPMGNPADVDGDGEVGVLDLTLVIVNWGECDDDECDAADINDDDAVDVADLVLVLTNWTS
jgi:hypothetical protein